MKNSVFLQTFLAQNHFVSQFIAFQKNDFQKFSTQNVSIVFFIFKKIKYRLSLKNNRLRDTIDSFNNMSKTISTYPQVFHTTNRASKQQTFSPHPLVVT